MLQGDMKNHVRYIFLTLQQSSAMMYKLYLGMHVIICSRTSIVLIYICMLMVMRENAYYIVCRVIWIFSTLASEFMLGLHYDTCAEGEKPTPNNVICIYSHFL